MAGGITEGCRPRAGGQALIFARLVGPVTTPFPDPTVRKISSGLLSAGTRLCEAAMGAGSPKPAATNWMNLASTARLEASEEAPEPCRPAIVRLLFWATAWVKFASTALVEAAEEAPEPCWQVINRPLPCCTTEKVSPMKSPVKRSHWCLDNTSSVAAAVCLTLI
jgi:hypothetical protein